MRWVRGEGTHRYLTTGMVRLQILFAHAGCKRKRCQPCYPPATAVQDAGAQVERNGFIHALVSGTADEGKGYEYFGERA